MPVTRIDSRRPDQLRPVTLEAGIAPYASGSVLIGFGSMRGIDAGEWTRRLVKECGVFAGISSGAAMAGAAKVATEIAEGVVVFIVSDGGWKYLSTGAYTDDLDSAEKQAERTIYF